MKFSYKIIAFLSLFLAVFLTGCDITPVNSDNNEDKDTGNIDSNNNIAAIIEITSIDDLNQVLDKQNNINKNNVFRNFDSNSLSGSIQPDLLESSQVSSQQVEYSKTNNQEIGVDESDIVKTDGKYIYVLYENKIIILKKEDTKTDIIGNLSQQKSIYDYLLLLEKLSIQENENPSESVNLEELEELRERFGFSENLSATQMLLELEELEDLELDLDYRYVNLLYGDFYEEENIIDFLIKDNKIFVFSNSNSDLVQLNEEYLEFRTDYEYRTKITVYENKNDYFEQVTSYSVDGYYSQARLIDEHIYFISQKRVNDENIFFPTFFRDNIGQGNIRTFYFPQIETETFIILSSLDTTNLDNFNSQAYLLDWAFIEYFSKNSLFLVSNEKIQIDYKEKFEQTIGKLLPANLISSTDSNQEIKNKVEIFFKNMAIKDKLHFLGNLSTLEAEYSQKQQLNYGSIITKFSFNNGEISLVNSQKVRGTPLNRFSLSEYDENLRIATTINIWSRDGRYSENFVSIFDDELNLLSTLDSIAINETIYSARFDQELLYLVTFEEIDPFFVINLSDTQNPTILGELKIPGFSNYLQVYNSSYVVGFGREPSSEENEFGWRSFDLKISLFDVTDKLNPIEVDKYIFDSDYSYSESLTEPKSILLSNEKQILAFPIYKRDDYYGNSELVIFTIKDQKFEKQTIVEGEFTEEISRDDDYSYYPYYLDRELFKRSFYIDNDLYAVSNKGIYVIDLNSYDIKEKIEFPKINSDRYDTYGRGFYPVS